MGVIKTIGLLGGGVIGGGWAARCLMNGLDVVLFDPDPDTARKLEDMLQNARRAYRKLTSLPLGNEGRLRIVRTPEEAVFEADFVQESAPERADLKMALLARASRAAHPDIVFGSSTSGLLPSTLQSQMTNPERLVVGHPFNPVYLLPLVEIVGGNKTSKAAKERAAAFYSAIGMKPLHVRKEVDGFIADRLLEALWREALWLVNDNVATTEEVDDAIRYGAGLRWAFMGTFLIYRIAGGEAGIRHFLTQFGPALKWPWTRLMDVPELTVELLDKIERQSDAQAGGKSIRELERLRDDCLVSVMQALRGYGIAAGATLQEYEERLGARRNPPATSKKRELSAPLRLYEAFASSDWINDNDAIEKFYAKVFDAARDAFLSYVGVDFGSRGFAYFTVETDLAHRGNVEAGAQMHTTTQLRSLDGARLHLFHTLFRSDDQALLATANQTLVHCDTDHHRACPPPSHVLHRLEEIAEAHARLPLPPDSG
jgi:carnitine 3-dehydrogenase